MRLHLVGPYFGYPHCINKSIEAAAEVMGWSVQVTDPRSSTRHKRNWVPEIARTKADFILCSTVEAWHRALESVEGLPPKILWLREEYRRPIIKEYLEECHKFYDHIFYFDVSGQKLIRSDLGLDTEFLPLAFDPNLHRRINLEREIDVIFIGSTTSKEGDFYKNREYALKLMTDAGIGVISLSCWDPKQNSETYSKSKIAFNLGSYWEETGPPELLRGVGYQERVFESMASAPLVFNHKVREGMIFHNRQHLIEYDAENLIDLIRHYLSNEDEARGIAEMGYQFLRKKHTYRQRLQRIVETLGT